MFIGCGCLRCGDVCVVFTGLGNFVGGGCWLGVVLRDLFCVDCVCFFWVGMVWFDLISLFGVLLLLLP